MTDQTKQIEKPSETAPPESRPRSIVGSIALVLLGALLAGLAGAIYSGIHARTAAAASLARATEEQAIPYVSTTRPKVGAPTEEIVLPGNTQAFVDTPIYARTNGYLRRWYYDIGTQVKKGDLLAEIETPEIDQQLQQARADLDTAQANLHLAETTATRWQFLLKSNSVSQQETDEKIGDLSAKKATVDSSLSNVRRLEQLQAFQRVYAPFDGLITARNTDVGALIDAGANAPGKELFHMAAISKLRVYVSVPEVFSRAARPGAAASLTLDEFPGQSFRGTLVRTSNSIDAASRTLLTEVDVDNPRGRLLPGAYVSVHLKLPQQVRSVTVPSNTLLFRSEGLRVAVVREGRAELVPVTIGRDYGATVEIVSGLGRQAPIILDPPDSITSGTPVRMAAGGAAQ